MTDPELLALLHNKSPDALSPSELATLRERVTADANFHRILIDQHGLELYLTQALGPNYTQSPRAATTDRDSETASATSPNVPAPRENDHDEADDSIVHLVDVDDELVEDTHVHTLASDAHKRNAIAQGNAPPELSLLPMAGGGLLLVLIVLIILRGALLTPPGQMAHDQLAVKPASTATDDERPTSVDASGESPSATHATTASGSAPPFSLTWAAEKFTDGNLEIDRSGWGNKESSIVRSNGSDAAFVTYQVEVPRTSEFELRLRFASFESRPLKLLVDGKLVSSLVAGEQTGGWFPDKQAWQSAARFSLTAGKHLIRLERVGLFPHLSQLALGDVSPTALAGTAPLKSAPATPAKPAVATTDGPGKSPDKIAINKTDGQPGKTTAVAAEKVPLLASTKPAATKPANPWAAVLEAKGETPKFADVCYDDFDTVQSLTLPEELKRWLEPVAGQPFNVSLEQQRLGHCAAFNGLARLKSPWTADTALRLSLESFQQLKLHFFTGNQGVTFTYFENQNLKWVAYTTERKEGGPQPSALYVCNEDEGRWRRTEMRYGGPFEIRYRDGEMILSRGKIAILRAPISAPPTETYVEGHAAVYGIAIVRSAGGPARNTPPQAALDAAKPSELKWTSETPQGQKVTRRDDGSILLASEATTQGFGQIATELPNFGPSEVVMQLSDVAAGAGVFLGYDGKPHEVLRFLKDPRSSQLIAEVRGPDDSRDGNAVFWRDGQFNGCGSAPWVRIIFAGGIQRYWIGPDGQHWAEAVVPQIQTPGNVTHVGLFCPGGNGKCSIGLKRLMVRPFALLCGLAETAILAKASAFVGEPSLGPWLGQTLRTQPEGIEAGAWRRACALKTLGRGCNVFLAQALLNGLLDDAQKSKSWDEQLALLDEAAPMVDAWGNQGFLSRFVNRYRFAASIVPETELSEVFRQSRDHLLANSLVTQQSFPVVSEALLRDVLVTLVYRGADAELLSLLHEIRFYQQHHERPLVEWIEAGVAGRFPSADLPQLPGPKRRVARPIVVEMSNKDSYRSLAELQALLDAKAWDEAARMLTSLDALARGGLAPQIHDRKLSVSLTTAIQSALTDYPELARSLRSGYAQISKLRVDKAIAEGNEPAVRLAAVQFPQTEAETRAHLWLGDRALASGRIDEALGEYAALAGGSTSWSAESAARKRLAAALLGREDGPPIKTSVRLGDATLSADDFERLLGDLRKQAPAATLGPPVTGAAGDWPKPRSLEIGRRLPLVGEIGENPNEVPGLINQGQVRWMERQQSVTLADNMVFVSNRQQVVAYDLAADKETKEKWRSQPVPGAKVRALAWPLVTMTPVVSGKFVLARQLHERGTVIVCLEKDTGKTVWNFLPGSNQLIASDPVVLGERIFVLVAGEHEQNTRRLRLVALDPQTGEQQSAVEWLRLSDAWDGQRMCAIVQHDQQLIASLAGAVVCGDLTSGNVRWVRQQTCISAEADRGIVQQPFEPPLWRAGRLYVTAPGVRAVECLDATTGKLYWRKVLPSVRRLAGFVAQRLVVECDEELLALEPNDGTKVWSTDLPENRLSPVVSGGEGGVLYVESRPTGTPGNNNRIPTLVWLDPDSGALRATAKLPGLACENPSLIPLFTRQGRIWASVGNYTGQQPKDYKRELVELTPQGDAIPSPRRMERSEWLSQTPPLLREAFAESFPGWLAVQDGGGNESGKRVELDGEKAVVACNAKAPTGALFARQIKIPDNGSPRLAIQAGVLPGITWQLEVWFGGKLLTEKKFEIKPGDKPWSETSADLSGLKGRSGSLVVRVQYPMQTDGRFIAWRKLELVP